MAGASASAAQWAQRASYGGSAGAERGASYGEGLAQREVEPPVQRGVVVSTMSVTMARYKATGHLRSVGKISTAVGIVTHTVTRRDRPRVGAVTHCYMPCQIVARVDTRLRHSHPS